MAADIDDVITLYHNYCRYCADGKKRIVNLMGECREHTEDSRLRAEAEARFIERMKNGS